MEVQYVEQKFKIFENILSVNNDKLLQKLSIFIKEFISEYENLDENKSEKNIESFEKWNEQFTDDRNLNEFIPEYQMTLEDFRRQIYESETGETIPLSEFQKKLKNLYKTDTILY